MEMHAIARRRMDESGHLYTPGRQLVMEVLARLGAPVTIPTILGAEPGLKQSSLYRNLAVLQETGLVTRVDVGDDYAYFELSEAVTHDHHHHLVCRDCRSVIDIALPAPAERALDKAFEAAASDAGFTLEEHRVDLVGLCADCRAG